MQVAEKKANKKHGVGVGSGTSVSCQNEDSQGPGVYPGVHRAGLVVSYLP